MGSPVMGLPILELSKNKRYRGAKMQYRMKTHQLDKTQINNLLTSEQVAVLATINEDGSPYTTPVHFLYQNDHIYVHGLPIGKKLNNIKKDDKVCLSVYRMEGLLLDENGKPCDTNTEYESVIIQGSASIVTNTETKAEVLKGIVKKYTPHISNALIPEKMIKGTGVISIAISEMTGKYWA